MEESDSNFSSDVSIRVSLSLEICEESFVKDLERNNGHGLADNVYRHWIKRAI